MLRESNFKEDLRDVKVGRKLARRKKEAENRAPMSNVMIEEDEVGNVRVRFSCAYTLVNMDTLDQHSTLHYILSL